MPEGEVVHYYNVVTGRIACGVKVVPELERTVFLDRVSCPACLKAAHERAEKRPE
jgi:hypothetical protein